MGEKNNIAPYVYPGRIGAIDWNAFASTLLNTGLSAYQVTQQVEIEKAKAAAAAAAGQQYALPGSTSAGMSAYMPYILGGVGLIAIYFLLKKR